MIAPILTLLVALILHPTTLAFRIDKHADFVLRESFSISNSASLLEARQTSPATNQAQPHRPERALNQLGVFRSQVKSKVTKRPAKRRPDKKVIWLAGSPTGKFTTQYLCGGFPPEREDASSLLPGVTHTEKLTGFIGTGPVGPGSYPVFEALFVDDLKAMGIEGAEPKKQAIEAARKRGVEKIAKSRARNREPTAENHREDAMGEKRGKMGQ